MKENFKTSGALEVCNKIRIYKIYFLNVKQYILSKHDNKTAKEKSLQINASIRTFRSTREKLFIIKTCSSYLKYFPELLEQP